MTVLEETHKIKKEIPSIGSLRIIRNDEGVEVFFKSEVLEAFFKRNQRSDARKESSTNEGWRGLEFYTLKSEIQQSLSRGEAMVNGMVGQGALYNSGYGYNFSMLRAVGLGKGVKILFPMPTSTERIEAWKSAFTEYLRWLYTNFMRPVDVEISITVKEMEA